jgi:hypothetical protein
MASPAFDNYADLVAAIQDTLNRADLANAIPNFITLTEGEINADDRFRVLPSLVRATATLVVDPTLSTDGGYYIPVPADYISMQSFRILEVPPPGRVDVITTAQADEIRQVYQTAGIPKWFTVVGEEMELLPAPDTTYTAQMIYYSEVPPLATNNINWLLQRYPQVYYYGALLQAAPYLKDDDRLAVWRTLYEAAAEKIHISNDRGQFSGAPMKMRTNRRYR